MRRALTVRAMTPQIAGCPHCRDGADPHRKEGRANPVAARIADILLQVAVESPARKCAGAAREPAAERS
ncbi:hypothetical protein [Mesorhizobium mediterraneum]|uniref:hypothetical protein n=1 Tax=Mesorhizobium mediterraneum TaxID=43617 RepID=UPI001782DAE8|nr:hypothetical protein [Mesorhizobium mediterraneum]